MFSAETALLMCRAKVELLFMPQGLALRNAKHLLQISYADLSRVTILDGMPEERTGKAYMLFTLRKGCTVPHGKQQLSTVALEFSASAVLTSVPANGGTEQKVCCFSCYVAF